VFVLCGSRLVDFLCWLCCVVVFWSRAMLLSFLNACAKIVLCLALRDLSDHWRLFLEVTMRRNEGVGWY